MIFATQLLIFHSLNMMYFCFKDICCTDIFLSLYFWIFLTVEKFIHPEFSFLI